ncbi:helix-turn-helix domain-containing protein [Actinokineospora guangxiensis]|uniref:Helix-turn-helix domain-containing protein n=1 Tax=Actinokineospora guangxiensis TaxID=1490288 RepID=A0ABW0EXT3_9PSEU
MTLSPSPHWSPAFAPWPSAAPARSDQPERQAAPADARGLPAEVLGHLRRQVVAAVEAGIAQVEAARRFGVSRQTVGLWVRDYRNRGEGAFRPGRRGRKPGEQLALTTEQQLAIASAVAAGAPESAGLDHLLWSRQAVVDLVAARFGLGLGAATAGNYLVRWGFPLPQDLLRSLRRTSSEPDRATWLAGAEVVWIGHAAPAWCPGALRPTLVQAVSNRGALTFLAADPADADAVHGFVDRLIRQTARRFNVVVTWQPEGHEQVPDVLSHGEATAAIRFLPAETA